MVNCGRSIELNPLPFVMIDLDHLEQYVAGDAALRDEILSIFTDQIESLRPKIDVDAEDEAWRDIMHAIKGAARGVGAWDVGELCESAEGLVGSASDIPAQRRELSRRLEEMLTAMIDHVRALRQDIKRLPA